MPQTITNNAQIEYQYETVNNTISLETQTNYVTTNIVKNNITVLKTSSKDHFGPNDTIIYNLFISNNSSSSIHNIEIAETLSEFIKYIPNSSNITLSDGITTQITDSNDPNDIERPIVGYIIDNDKTALDNAFGFKINSIEPNSTTLISFSVKVSNNKILPESISSSSILSYSSSKDNISRTVVESNTVTLNKAYALLNAVKSVDKTTAFSGDSLTYTITLSNQGNVNALNVHITDSLPNNFELSSVDLVIADLPYKIGYRVDENNTLTVPASTCEPGFCVPANSDDSVLTIKGIIN